MPLLARWFFRFSSSSLSLSHLLVLPPCSHGLSHSSPFSTPLTLQETIEKTDASGKLLPEMVG